MPETTVARSATTFCALIKNLPDSTDMEAALAYTVEKMIMPVNDRGEPRKTLFGDFNPNRPDSPQQLQARFLTWLKFALGNIRRGKVPRLSTIERRPPGTLSIGQGRTKKGEEYQGVSPEAIPARPSGDTHLSELIEDIATLLRQKERAVGLPLVDLFRSIMAGKNKEQQVALFGDRPTRAARPIVVQTIKDYAERTENYWLLNLLRRYEGFQGNKPMPPKRTVEKTAKPVMSDEDRDFHSIVSAVERFGNAGSSQLGTVRRRWLSYAPRDPNAGFRNRLEEVLAKATERGILKAVKTSQGALRYELGPNAEKYRQQVAAVGE